MSEFAKDGVTDAANLLMHYGFDLGGHSIDRLIDRWLRTYPRHWLRSAAIEALYQGRYKAFSVEQILAVWRRKGQPLQHFNHEFERIVCSVLPQPQPPPLEVTPAKPLPAEPVAQLSAPSSTLAEPVCSLSKPAGSSMAVVVPARVSEQYPERVAAQYRLAAEAALPASQLHQPIHRFVPAPATSEFYSRLKAVAQDDRPGEKLAGVALSD